GDVFPAFGGSFNIHHLAAQASMGQAECIHQRIYVVHSNPVDQNIGGGVVADRHHHGGEVAIRDTRYAGSEAEHDRTVGHHVGRVDGINVGQLQLALLSLMIELGEHRHLNTAGLGKDFIRAQEIALPGVQVENGEAEHAVEVAVDFVDRGLQLVPEDLLLVGG